MNPNPLTLSNEYDLDCHQVATEVLYLQGVLIDPYAVGQQGAPGQAATVAVGTTSTLSAGSSAMVTNVGTSSAAVFNFGLPSGSQGAQGIPGSAATVSVGTVTALPSGSTPTVVNAGTSSAARLNFGLVSGAQGIQGVAGAQGIQGVVGAQGIQGVSGAAATVSVGTVTALPPGSTPTVVNAGTSSAARFNFGLVSGSQGIQGVSGAAATVSVGTVTALPPGSTPTVTNVGTSNAAVLNYGIVSGATGSIAASYKSMWQPFTQYRTNDVIIWGEDTVQPKFSCYIALQDNITQTPPRPYDFSSPYWALLAAHGNDGGTGPAGSNGTSVSVTDVLSALMTFTAFVAMQTEIDGLGTAVGALQAEVGALAADIAALDSSMSTVNAKLIWQGSSSATMSTSWGGQSMTKLAADSASSAVTLNASTASTFSKGATVSGGLSADSLNVSGAFSAPNVSFANNSYVIGSAANPLSTTFLYGQVLMPHENMLDTWGFVKTAGGFMSQFP